MSEDQTPYGRLLTYLDLLPEGQQVVGAGIVVGNDIDHRLTVQRADLESVLYELKMLRSREAARKAVNEEVRVKVGVMLELHNEYAATATRNIQELETERDGLAEALTAVGEAAVAGFVEARNRLARLLTGVSPALGPDSAKEMATQLLEGVVGGPQGEDVPVPENAPQTAAEPFPEA